MGSLKLKEIFVYLRNAFNAIIQGALAMSEPGAGSDVMSMKIKAEQNSDGDFVLNGSKVYL